jgi:hypothetical protein
MPPQDPNLRLMKEYRALALDLAARWSVIENAARLKSSLFRHDTLVAVRDFAHEAELQRGGNTASINSSDSPERVAEEFVISLARIDTLTGKLQRGRFARDPMVLAGLSIRSAAAE